LLNRLQKWLRQLKPYWPVLKKIAAPTHNETRLHEKLLASLGGFLAILLIGLSTHWIQPETTWLMVASMGASSVLLFAVPHGPMSQPWPVIGSHLVAACVGVSMSYLFSDPIWMAAAAISITIFLMYHLGCLHPPGGATSLIAVVGVYSGVEVGYEFVLFPVLANLLVLMLVAIVFNNLQPKRRYPAYFAPSQPQLEQDTDKHQLSRTEFAKALKEMGSFVDITENELQKLIALTSVIQGKTQANELKVGQCYSNGVTGARWSVLEIKDLIRNAEGQITYVSLKHRAGQKPDTAAMPLSDFLNWSAYQVEAAESGWQRVV